MKEKSKGFILKLLVLVAALVAFPLSAAIAAPVGIAPLFAPAPGGTPLYSWGQNTNGFLGHGDTVNRNEPTRVGDADNWVQVSSGTGGAAALNIEGHIYTWGALWTANAMGQADNPANPGTGLITVPTRMGDRDNWTYVLVMGGVVTAINDQGHLYTWGANANGQLGLGDTDNRSVPTRVGTASNWVMARAYGTGSIAINDQGHLYTWGPNGYGQLGQGAEGGPFQLTPQRVGTASNWISIGSIGASSLSAINDQGHLFTWGRNHAGQLGHGDFDNRDVPTRVGTASNWIDVIGNTNAGMIALNSDGHIYTWGNPASGRLGRVVDGANPQELPGRVEGSNWVAIGGGNAHSLAMTADMRFYTWGLNTSGQLGIGETGGYRSEPTFVLQAFGLAGFTQSAAGFLSMALIRTVPAEDDGVYLTKNLQKPQGTDLLGDIIFTFNFERYSFNGNTALSAQVPNIPNRTITLNNASSSSNAANITTTTDNVNVLENIEFTQAGVFAWRVSEAATTVSAPSSIVDSQAEYILRVYVSQEPGIGGALYIYTITLHRLYCNDGEVYNPPYKTDDFSFTNIYTRTTTGSTNGALVISKSVTGPFADLTTVFNFEVTLTRTAMCPVGTTFIGQVYNANNTPSGTPITFTSGTMQTVNLTHGQRIVFDEFLVGTRFTVTELAAPGFIASVNLVVDGSTVTVPGNTNHNQDLSIEGPHIAGSAENSAAFTNAHNYVPTGLSVSNTLTVLPFIAATGLIFLLASKHRKRIEQLPLV